MKRIVIFLSLPLLMTSLAYSAEEIKGTENKAGNTTEVFSIQGDTIVKSVVVLKANEDNKTKNLSSTTTSSSRTTSASRRDDQRYDTHNSGFFDEYMKSYDGDPNENLEPIVKVTESKEAIRKKKEIEATIEKLEEKNKEQKETQRIINEDIKKYNQEVEEENKIKDKELEEFKKTAND